MQRKGLTVNLRPYVGTTLMVVLAAGCATGRSYVNGQKAAKAGDWDAAVQYYRDALNHDAGRVDIRLALERAMRTAAAGHMARARQLEEQQQLPGAAAEYRLAADSDPTNTLAAAKAIEIDRVIRQKIEDSRPKSQMQEMRDQARRISALPQLAVDPRIQMPALNFNQTAVRDILASIVAFAGINVTYDSASGSDAALSKAYTVNLQGVTLQDALNQVLSANTLFYKVVDPRTILVALDNQNNRQRLEDQVVQMFYLSHADATEMNQSLTTVLNQVQGLGVRPVIQPNKTANSLMVRASVAVMEVIERLIRASDKPRAEVVIDVEILEVDRTRASSYGLNLSQYQLGFAMSPEAPPAANGSVSPFNLNTISQGVSTADFYLSVPTAIIKALESDSRTKILAKPSLRGTEGKAVQVNLGEQIPVPSTTFAPIAAGGVASQPTTSFTLKDVGVNVSMTPTVTYDNEIRLDVTVENSAKGPDVNVAGSALPSFSSRKVQTTLRLRDGESNLIAGLIREEDKKSLQGLPGISKVPILRTLFGGSEKSTSTSDIVMLITPRIVRGHEMTLDDLKPIYVGSQQNFGLTGAPPLIATPLTAEELAAAAVTGQTPANAQGAGQTPAQNPATQQTAAPPATQPQRNPVVVPVTPVGGQAAQNPAAVQNPPAGATPPPTPTPKPGTVSLQPPPQMQAGAGPYTIPIQISDATQLGSVLVTLTYNPAVLRARTVTEGPFLKNGGLPTTFTPRIDEAAGRIEILIGRPAGAAGVSGAGILGAIMFDAVAAGQGNVTVSVAALSPTAQALPMTVAPITIVVK